MNSNGGHPDEREKHPPHGGSEHREHEHGGPHEHEHEKHHEHNHGDHHDHERSEHHEGFRIKIDREHYEVHQEIMTGAELRALPTPHIGPELDLFEVVPGGTDRKLSNTDRVHIKNGMRFFTAPAQINPGLVC